MSESKQRKTAPPINEEADRSLPLSKSDGVSSTGMPSYGNEGNPVKPSQREPRLNEKMAYSKLRFGQRLICGCIALIVGLSLVGYFFEGVDNCADEFGTAFELLKLVTTTALGFVFAKTQVVEHKKDGDN